MGLAIFEEYLSHSMHSSVAGRYDSHGSFGALKVGIMALERYHGVCRLFSLLNSNLDNIRLT
jgi:hypothetical protein